MEEIREADKHNSKFMAEHICEYILTVTQGQTESENLDTYAFLLAMIASPPADNVEERVQNLAVNALYAREYLAKTFDLDCAKNLQE